ASACADVSAGSSTGSDGASEVDPHAPTSNNDAATPAARSDRFIGAPKCFLSSRLTHRRAFLRVPRNVRIARFTENYRGCGMGRVLGQDRRRQSTQRREVAVGADQPKTRLADIARHAGLSTATVSRVINGKPGVSSTARRQVLAA